MKILAFADIPSSIVLPKVEPDVVVLLGHLPDRLIKVIDNFYSDSLKLSVLNEVKDLKDTSIINLNQTFLSYRGIMFAGFRGQSTYVTKKAGDLIEREFQEFIKTWAWRHVDVFLSCSYPVYYDKLHDSEHSGFELINELIKKKKFTHLIHSSLNEQLISVWNESVIYSVYGYVWLTDLENNVNFLHFENSPDVF